MSPAQTSTATAPQAALSVTTDRTVLVPSETTPGVTYRTSPNGCDCAAFYFGRLKDASYRCKHMIRRFPARRLCEYCGIDVARQASCFCSDTCAAMAVAEECIAANDEEWSGEAGLVLEQLTDTWATAPLADAPICPGYLREHAHLQGEAVTLWCPLCDCEGGDAPEPRETAYETPASEDTLWEAEQAAMDRADSYTQYVAELAAECETAQEPAFDALTAERIAFAAMLHARQVGDESVRALREAVSTQAARWLPSATGAITRMPVVSALDSLFG